jgi:hypothetical protein
MNYHVLLKELHPIAGQLKISSNFDQHFKFHCFVANYKFFRFFNDILLVKSDLEGLFFRHVVMGAQALRKT